MKRFFIVCLAVTLTGCGWLYGREGIIHDRANEYLDAKPVPRMQIPEGLPANNEEQDYLVIPSLAEEAQPAVAEDFEIPTPPPLLAATENEKVADSVSLVDTQASVDSGSVEADVQLVEDGAGNAALQFSKNFDETWDEVGAALKAAEIKIVDLNRTFETYDIEYDDLPLQLSIKAVGDKTMVTVLQDKKIATLGLSQEVLEQIKINLPKQ